MGAMSGKDRASYSPGGSSVTQQAGRTADYRTTVIALTLMLLTFVRTVELCKAEWSEFDLDRAEWRIPAEGMKMREA